MSSLHSVTAWVRERRTVVAWSGALTLAGGALLLPATAAAQTVLPTTPGSSAFTSAAYDSAAPAGAQQAALVQVAEPSPYRLPGSASSQDAVTVADSLAPAPAPETPPAPAPAPAPTQAPAPVPAAPAWSAPTPGEPISNPYGKKNPSYAAGYHTGVDFAVSVGTPLLAVGDATVVSAGYDGAYGNEVVLRLSDGHFAEYAHLSSLSVHAGQTVTPGQQVGKAGTTGNSTGPHLHFEIRSANKYGAVIDPIAFLAARGVTDF
ncbi:M23 family metallopeptidase [Kitasatospora sp. NBC_00070]|uniref:M23 family metallopeptidase n=1 Tax=Kitasatospora sp. NBC_00070 TaxID=2975962 RepID=UPI003249C2C3